MASAGPADDTVALDEMVAALVQVQPAKWDQWEAVSGLTKSQFMKRYSKLKASGRVLKNKVTGLWESTGF
jgi:hypothetical protein